MEDNMNIYDFTVNDAHNQAFNFSQLKNKVVLIVNVASKCGFTPQYTGLQALYHRYNEQGFEIIGFPCNQFGNQEPGTNEEISQFCSLNYGVSFPIMEKVAVNGSETAPIYLYLKEQKHGLLGKNIKWNFEKFLIDKTGKVVGRFAPTIKPEELEQDIINLLK
jgi:glutathione peroxidase-family protein